MKPYDRPEYAEIDTSEKGFLIPLEGDPEARRSPIGAVPARKKRDLGKERSHLDRKRRRVGFSMGFTCTSFIAEEDAANFLYWYPSGSLEHVMDSEVRGRIQQISAEVAAKYPLDTLR